MIWFSVYNKLEDKMQTTNMNAEKPNECQYHEHDLNSDTILEHWNVKDALREIMSNAYDEHSLRKIKKEVEIYKDADQYWHIRDYGNGLAPNDLIQNINPEKVNSEDTIGQFGIGLKDAFAVLWRENVNFICKSKCLEIIRIEKKQKNKSGLKALHAIYRILHDNKFCGTEYIFKSRHLDEEIALAKEYFIRFNKLTLLEKTNYGEIYDVDNHARKYVYISGVKVNEESNFEFIYNITKKNKAIINALNRDKANVSRNAYRDQIINILKSSNEPNVWNKFTNYCKDSLNLSLPGEMDWQDVKTKASKKYSDLHPDCYFLTTSDVENYPELVDEIKNDGKKFVIAPKNIISAANVPTKDDYVEDVKNSYQYKWVDEDDLNDEEKKIWNFKDGILNIILFNKNIPIKISESIRPSKYSFSPVGLWDEVNNRIIIKKNQLKSLKDFAGTLFHECVHARTGYSDVNRDFEIALTSLIGILAEKALLNNSSQKNNLDSNSLVNKASEKSWFKRWKK